MEPTVWEQEATHYRRMLCSLAVLHEDKLFFAVFVCVLFSHTEKIVLCVYENLNKVGKASLPKSPFTRVAGNPVDPHTHILISHLPTSSLMRSEKSCANACAGTSYPR